MTRKKDPQIEENVDRIAGNEHSALNSEINTKQQNDGEIVNESDFIKNANAAGIGSIGRNDQNKQDNTDQLPGSG